MPPKRDHWVCLPDEALRLIEDGPEPDTDGYASEDDLWNWVEAVQAYVLDGLETA